MGATSVFTESMLANYGKAIRAAPREVIFNRNLLLSVLLYAMSAVPPGMYTLTHTMSHK
jgi:hypothetical protein